MVTATSGPGIDAVSKWWTLADGDTDGQPGRGSCRQRVQTGDRGELPAAGARHQAMQGSNRLVQMATRGSRRRTGTVTSVGHGRPGRRAENGGSLREKTRQALYCSLSFFFQSHCSIVLICGAPSITPGALGTTPDAHGTTPGALGTT
jgi:hypothetical protein